MAGVNASGREAVKAKAKNQKSVKKWRRLKAGRIGSLL
jgi:hypothetical protein